MTAIAADRESLRVQRKLRLVTKEEAGSSADDCPAGVYGFTYAPNSEGTPLFHLESFQIFEIHKLMDQSIHFVGYMTEEDARALETSSEPLELKLYPQPHGTAQKLVDVPRERIYRPKPSSRENGNWMQFVLAPK